MFVLFRRVGTPCAPEGRGIASILESVSMPTLSRRGGRRAASAPENFRNPAKTSVIVGATIGRPKKRSVKRRPCLGYCGGGLQTPLRVVMSRR